MEQPKEYYAFISYKREDEKWAKWLQHKLEHYRFQTNLNGRTDLPKEIRPVFKDTSELNPGNLPQQIRNALEQSKYLIVICSPRAAKSKWVNKEVETFIEMGRTDNIIPFIIEGKAFSKDPEKECFPEVLRSLPTEQEILGANISEMGRDAAVIKVVARMFDVKFDTLWRRHEREQRRKLWIWICVSVLIALFGLGIGGYYIKQNRIIENQNVQLLTAKVHQDISLARAYLSQNRPEMTIMIINEIERNLELLDSVKLIEYQQLRESLCDSVMKSPVLLVDVLDEIALPQKSLEAIFAQSDAFQFQPMKGNGPLDDEYVYISNKITNTSDTIYGNPKIIFKASQNYAYMAFLDFKADKYIDFDQDGFPKDCYISVFSLKTGALESAVPCSIWFSGTYPISVSNDGNYLIYREESRSHVSIWFVDFKEQKRNLFQNWYTNPKEAIASAFSPNDRYFFVYYSEKKEISLYLTHSQEKFHTFRYENCEDVFWDESGNLCISSEGKWYVWEISEIKHSQLFDIGTYANGVAISSNKKYGAAACNNGIVYIWNVSSGKMVFGREIMNAPEDVAFSKDDKTLWVVSGYNSISTINIESGKTNEVYEEPELIPHPWPTYLYITKDGKYCVSYCNFKSRYTIVDMQGESHDDENFLEFEYPERFNYDPSFADVRKPVLTARRGSSDGEMCIESYSNGIIKIVSLKARNSLCSLLQDKNVDN